MRASDLKQGQRWICTKSWRGDPNTVGQWFDVIYITNEEVTIKWSHMEDRIRLDSYHEMMNEYKLSEVTIVKNILSQYE